VRQIRFGMTVFVVATLLSLLSFPWSVGLPPPEDTPRREVATYAKRLLAYTTIVGVCVFGSALFAFFMLRRIRRDYAEEATQNLADLLTAEIQSKKKDEQNLE
jgi:hypothetical protein